MITQKVKAKVHLMAVTNPKAYKNLSHLLKRRKEAIRVGTLMKILIKMTPMNQIKNRTKKWL